MSEKTMGQVAFEAYCDAVGGKTYDGKPIPGWDELHGDRLKVQGGWEAAALAAIHAHMMDALPSGSNRDFRERQASRWQPLSSIRSVPDDYSTAPGGAGEPPTGDPLPVDVEPDDEAPVECDHPGCTIAHDRD
jgi:hypothetical protein